MSIETFSPIPLTTFGSWVTLLDPSDVPPGTSPSLGDVDFFPGGIRTRPGLVSQLTGITAAPNINGLKTYITPNLVQRCILLDSLGTVYKETSPGVVSPISGGAISPNLYLASGPSWLTRVCWPCRNIRYGNFVAARCRPRHSRRRLGPIALACHKNRYALVCARRNAA